MELEVQDTLFSMLFADDKLLIAQDYEDLEYIKSKGRGLHCYKRRGSCRHQKGNS
jgi:hypothetical protein